MNKKAAPARLVDQEAVSEIRSKYKVAKASELREILEKQNYTCALTGAVLTPENAAFDHIEPLSKGGSSLAENLQAVTKDANHAKRNLSMSEFYELCSSIVHHLENTKSFDQVLGRKQNQQNSEKMGGRGNRLRTKEDSSLPIPRGNKR